MRTCVQIDDKWKPIPTTSADVESSYHNWRIVLLLWLVHPNTCGAAFSLLGTTYALPWHLRKYVHMIGLNQLTLTTRKLKAP